MDRINLKQKVFLGGFGVVLVLFLVIKCIDRGWLQPQLPLPAEFGTKPVLLFFNKEKGCDCELVVYQAAEQQMDRWAEQDRFGLPVYRYDLSRSPDLAKQFSIIRAPALLLIDSAGNVIHRQDEVRSDQIPFDLQAYQEKILSTVHNK